MRVEDKGGDIGHFFFFDRNLVESNFDIIRVFSFDMSVISFPHDLDGAIIERNVTGEFEDFKSELIFVLFLIWLEIFLTKHAHDF